MRSVAVRTLSRSVFCVVCLVCSLSLSEAQGNGRDSVLSVAIEPGITHVSIFKEGPFAINVLVVDLADTTLRLESFRTTGLLPTSQQVTRNNRPGHRVVAAINADFFSKEGWPVNNQVENGEFVFGTETQRSHLLVDKKGKTHIERISFDGWVKSKAGSVYPIASINDVHRTNSIVLHTSFSDSVADSAGMGMTFLLEVTQSWMVGRRYAPIGCKPGWSWQRYKHSQGRRCALGGSGVIRLWPPGGDECWGHDPSLAWDSTAR